MCALTADAEKHLARALKNGGASPLPERPVVQGSWFKSPYKQWRSREARDWAITTMRLRERRPYRSIAEEHGLSIDRVMQVVQKTVRVWAYANVPEWRAPWDEAYQVWRDRLGFRSRAC